MTEQVCPNCGCSIEDKGYEKDGVTYCCQQCAEEGHCDCSHHRQGAHMPDSGFGEGGGGGDAG